ncbi:HBL114Cp [Eremothecium sinecaudum]|uniref:protein-serine/threonine phosphatase n=1 Tax=Eremothecium sinecaudum TaxID=45286 RepID=A0A109UWI5_9SACH|nr:HBL114Cp [Eremothecium sinecaudum]AMD18788.1 HBL114Cp [Eremothecium sinecaudum]
MGQLLSHPLTEKTIIYNDYSAETNLQLVVPQQQKQLFLKPQRSSERLHRLHLRRHSHDNKAGGQESNMGSVPESNSVVTGGYVQFYNCVGSMQGYRLTQEDSHIISNNDSQLTVNFRNPISGVQETLHLSVFGVFDGHGGDECSIFLANSPNGILKWIKYTFENHKYGKYGNQSEQGGPIKRRFRTIEGLVSQILKDAFALQDNELHSHFANSTCGSTAIMAIIVNGQMLYVVNCGDSRCILSSSDKCIKNMSFDHKPQHISELIRINDDGGTVTLGRVGGVLALSRAFGDFQFKKSVAYTHSQLNNPGGVRRFVNFAESQVTVEPDILAHKVDYLKDEFLVLACDGIWDIYSNKSLIQFIKYHLILGLKLDEIVTRVLDHGIANADSSTGVGFDNMTVVIVVLNRPGETLDQWYAKMKSRLEKEKGLV